MKARLLSKLFVLIAVCSLGQLSLADNATAAREIAGILTGMNHFPSDADKMKLMAIAQDESNGAGYRAVANAVHNIQHSATDADKAILNQIIASNQADPNAKALAGVVVGFNHMASDDAKATLASMM